MHLCHCLSFLFGGVLHLWFSLDLCLEAGPNWRPNKILNRLGMHQTGPHLQQTAWPSYRSAARDAHPTWSHRFSWGGSVPTTKLAYYQMSNPQPTKNWAKTMVWKRCTFFWTSLKNFRSMASAFRTWGPRLEAPEAAGGTFTMIRDAGGLGVLQRRDLKLGGFLKTARNHWNTPFLVAYLFPKNSIQSKI